MAQPLLPALHAALLQLVEGEEQRPACSADHVHKRVDMAAGDVIAGILCQADAADADIHRLPAQIAKRIVVARRSPEQRRNEGLRGNGEVRQLLQLSADRDDQRTQIEVTVVAALVENLALERLGEVAVALNEHGLSEPAERRWRARGHEITLR